MKEHLVRLYHGTTKEAATRILVDGFVAFDRQHEAERVAAEFELDVGELLDRVKGDYVTIGHLRECSASFAGQRIYAARYAGRDGGEARSELLIAAWKILNNSHDSATAHRWASERCAGEPVVVVVDAPFELIREHLPLGRFPRANPTFDDYMLSFIGKKDLPLPTPLPPNWVAAVTPVEPALYPGDIARLFGPDIAGGDLPRGDGLVSQ